MPATTGSIDPPVEVARPLPPTLSYSDAARIGQAARAALWQAEGGGPEEWVNARTGSSGTLTAGSRTGSPPDCRPFSTSVTSLAGVHQYSGMLCRSGETKTVLNIAEHGV
ncbi:MAG: RT0821/Lpp0805 family surface protein [Propylenella sp.]